MAWLSVNFNSKALKRPVDIEVLMPQNKKASKVLFLLHGAVDGRNGWLLKSQVECLAEEKNLCVVMPDGMKEKVESISYSHRGCSGFPWILIYTDNDRMHMEFINYTGDTRLFDSLSEVLKEQGCDSELGLSELEILDKFVLADVIE